MVGLNRTPVKSKLLHVGLAALSVTVCPLDVNELASKYTLSPDVGICV